ncbi:GNAT family N-acetyltransferase [Arthrobacter sp. zg-Y826]|uniref:GNAT family N-acetyltransferase n=1 Tax=Arthrobacter jinronghuae TaxID=2964609 RepID=UPI002107C768|nr:GNAT family N-acetyltransferase [Arthrobacter jinronghuae]MCQ1956597.1 GNAT family N-acetyltransferase [Arthrobacter jinronghuae]
MPASPLLRPWTQADAPSLHAAFAADPSLEHQLGCWLDDVGQAAGYLETALADSPQRRSFAVDMDGTAVGNIGISAIDRRHQTAWVSYWLAPSARGHSLASRGVAAAAGWALRDGGLFRLELGHRTNNPASCRVALNAGFRPEGIERSKLRYGRDRFDVETHARLDPVPEISALPLQSPGPSTS